MAIQTGDLAEWIERAVYCLTQDYCYISAIPVLMMWDCCSDEGGSKVYAMSIRVNRDVPNWCSWCVCSCDVESRWNAMVALYRL